MMSTDRVRALLITSANELLMIKRIRTDGQVYWVLPGGGVDSGDATPESALVRELHEELVATIEIHSLVHIVERSERREFVYLARVSSWSFGDRYGLEFSDPERGEYHVEVLPLTAEKIGSLDIKPDEVRELVLHALRHGIDLFELPDLRSV
ncbi:MAG TPA: NUDIX domain-containing protein [Chloroflexota bacterium]|jgi:8-oxo-dGTP pyrophosphatase MutT (NUDIX family)|nr:NUDIX domain-containing protein [Chloroflexota bacterium]